MFLSSKEYSYMTRDPPLIKPFHTSFSISCRIEVHFIVDDNGVNKCHVFPPSRMETFPLFATLRHSPFLMTHIHLKVLRVISNSISQMSKYLCPPCELNAISETGTCMKCMLVGVPIARLFFILSQRLMALWWYESRSITIFLAYLNFNESSTPSRILIKSS